MKKSNIPFNEYFLHYIWNTKQIQAENLKTTQGQHLEIIHFGHYNKDAGPDFLNAVVKIDDTTWVGNLEIHVLSSDWQKHGHQHDAAYNNVVLHVVFFDDKPIQGIPCLSLKNRIPKVLIKRYEHLISNASWIPCASLISPHQLETFHLWKESLVVEKLEKKSKNIYALLQKYSYDWEQCFYILLARYFGGKVNDEPFENLAEKVPLDLIRKNDDKPMTRQALFFGQAGLLNGNCQDVYYKRLQDEYSFLQTKYHLQPMNPVAWKLKTLRPYNFPTLRIAEFSTLVHLSTSLFSKLMSCASIKEMYLLLDSEVDPYWSTHFLFGKIAGTSLQKISTSFKDILLINAFFPLVLAYARTYGKEEMLDWIFNKYIEIKSEKNHIIANWKKSGLVAKTMIDSQALLQLYNQYCKEKKCTECRFGHQFLSLKSRDQQYT